VVLHYYFFLSVCCWKIRDTTFTFVSNGKNSNDFSTVNLPKFPIDREYGKKSKDCMDIFDNYHIEEGNY